MRKVTLFLALVLSLSMFNSCGKRKITISQEFYDYAMEAIDIAEDYLAYRTGCNFKYTNYRFDDMEEIDLPPWEGIDSEIRNKEIEIWTKVVNLHVLFWAYDENPNTRDKVREQVNELKETLDGVVVGEVVINENQTS